MAFVNVGASAFSGAALRAPARAPVCGARRAARPSPASTRTSPTMVFTSIDRPETGVSLVDYAKETKALVLREAYRQVFGNAYLMEEERAELAVAESDFLLGFSDVRELVRAMAKSEGYRKRFFERASPYRYVELNCKHLLGRGPTGQEEISFHVQKVVNEGFEADIDSYLDSAEYEERFGSLEVPRFIYEGQYPKNDAFNRMNVMRMHWDGCSTSTKYGSTAPGRPMDADLLMGHGSYVTGFTTVSKGLPAGFRPEPSLPKAHAGIPVNPNATLKVRVEVAMNLYQVLELPGIPDPADTLVAVPEWKKEQEKTNPAHKWNGVWY